MDSANGHLAANYDVPVLTLWGMTHPFCGFTPFNQPQENSITLDRNNFPYVPTSIFGNKIPKGYENAFRSVDCQAKSSVRTVDEIKIKKESDFIKLRVSGK